MDACDLIVLDECGSNIGLTPLYARALKGQRACGDALRNRSKNTTLIAALTFEGMGASMIIEGAADAVAFERYAEELPAPSLTAGQIMIIDNLAPLFCQRTCLASLPLKKPFPISRPLCVEPELAPSKRSRRPFARPY